MKDSHSLAYYYRAEISAALSARLKETYSGMPARNFRRSVTVAAQKLVNGDLSKYVIAATLAPPDALVSAFRGKLRVLVRINLDYPIDKKTAACRPDLWRPILRTAIHTLMEEHLDDALEDQLLHEMSFATGIRRTVQNHSNPQG